MPDWKADPAEPGPAPPGKVDPPSPSEVKPTDDGWAKWVSKEIDKTGLKWGPECSLAFEVSVTGAVEQRAVEGDNPADYSAGKDWGWNEDRTYETTPPEPYQDFTRWVRHYPRIRLQKWVQYMARIVVRCGPHFVSSQPSFFWKADGAPLETSADEYAWTVTSGMDGKLKWTTTGKKIPPSWGQARPQDGYDFGHPQTSPPDRFVHPLPYHWEPDWKLGPDWGGFKDPLKLPYDPYFEPGGKLFKWIKIKDLF